MAFIIWQQFRAISDLNFQIKSGRVKTGKSLEQFMPFMKDFPYASDDCRFIGMPVDYIVFAL